MAWKGGVVAEMRNVIIFTTEKGFGSTKLLQQRRNKPQRRPLQPPPEKRAAAAAFAASWFGGSFQVWHPNSKRFSIIQQVPRRSSFGRPL
jgi:hypothetical protein